MHSILGNVHVPLQQLLDPLSHGYHLKLCQGDSNSSWKLNVSCTLFSIYSELLNLISFNSLNSLSRSAISSLSLEFYKYPLSVKKHEQKVKELLIQP